MIENAGVEQIVNLAGDKELVITRGDGLLEEGLEGDGRAVAESIGDGAVLVLGEREVSSKSLDAFLKGSLPDVRNSPGATKRRVAHLILSGGAPGGATAYPVGVAAKK